MAAIPRAASVGEGSPNRIAVDDAILARANVGFWGWRLTVKTFDRTWCAEIIRHGSSFHSLHYLLGGTSQQTGKVEGFAFLQRKEGLFNDAWISTFIQPARASNAQMHVTRLVKPMTQES
jgi:hypothetical protein